MGRGAALILALALAAGDALAGRFDRGLLWRVSRPGLAPSYVFGTIHLADPRVLEIPAPVLAALRACRSFLMEAPRGPLVAARMTEAAQYEDGRRLRGDLDAQTYEGVRALLAGRGVPEEVIERIKPWAALANLAVAVPDYGSETLDDRLFDAARTARLRIAALESTEEQIAVFESIPSESLLALLRHAVEQRDWLAAMVEPALQAWLARDLAALRRVHRRAAARFPAMKPHYERLFRHIVDHRNVAMAHRLHLPLREGRAFVAVGAAHLYGGSGLLALIEKQGYRVERVW